MEDGLLLGTADGSLVGGALLLGDVDGDVEGNKLGFDDGSALGATDGVLLGELDVGGTVLNIGIIDGAILNVGVLLGDDVAHTDPGTSDLHMSHALGQ